ncbi:alpha/beta hydrolase [Kribbella sp. NBC_01245]|uniref:alpha/beta fold hydrolase n=1 Tax=Kribbella sp. NBC_01245 TaxID=2903578 RepID=UPI002E27FC5A|nr:alpha/beta hydrolase [Kribbella sp. NBC_01245]
MFFLHGCPDTRRAAFAGEAAARRLGVRLIAVNRPGYGSSDAYDVPALDELGHRFAADDLVAVADAFGVGEFGLLGMSVGGPYALACAARHPERVRAVAVVAAPGMAPVMDPPCHRDDLSPEQRDFFATLAGGSVAANMALMRPDFEQYVARLRPTDDDDEALAKRFLEGLPPRDARLLAELPPKAIAESAREALANTDGYLWDAAITFRHWDFRPEDVARPVALWYGEYDANAPPRNGRWFADHLADATLVVRPTAHLGTLLEHWEEVLAAT